MFNVYFISSPSLDKLVTAKFARFDREVGYYISRIDACSWIEGHDVGPTSLGYLVEDDRATGFLIEREGIRQAFLGFQRTALSSLDYMVWEFFMKI